MKGKDGQAPDINGVEIFTCTPTLAGMVCYKCGKVGHFRKDCQKQQGEKLKKGESQDNKTVKRAVSRCSSA
ncbi:hypothetical protein DPMN_026492 [Dreissena polymorpha]|uniref:CCHC-type domain-containing protein n=1 Tax=Dreissena polymorpha TaxID=45954 RepID=A0A9D4RDJ5_DREPO|nr:hypothetical protein DPMN_026492 [Dreissena polymorpha]